MDTGADLCLIPASPADIRAHKHNTAAATGVPTLWTATEGRVKVYGTREIALKFGNRTFNQLFVIGNVGQNILGNSFFLDHNLGIDPKGKKLVDLGAGQGWKGITDANPTKEALATVICSVAAVATDGSPLPEENSDPEFQQLMREFPEILQANFKTNKVAHGAQHYIPTSCAPIRARPRRLDQAKLACAKAEFAEMERLGIIRRSSSPWASPLHVVPKANGKFRPCGDYRRLNAATEADSYPLPHIQTFNERLTKCTVFSKIDMVKGYHQIPMCEEHVRKTAIITPFSLFEFRRMPFGLKNSAQAFQRLMDSILGHMTYAFVYLDDILIASRDRTEHRQHLHEVFSLLRQHGLVVNIDKCELGVSELDFLGHHVSSAGIQPMQIRVKAIRDFPAPRDKAGLQRFLGMLNYYHRFVPHLAEVLIPLHEAVAFKGKTKNEMGPWSERCQTAFDQAKQQLADAALLHHPDEKALLRLTVDASDHALGAQLEQRSAGKKWAPIAFFSKKLSTAEVKYSAFDRELLGIYAAIRHFRSFLEARTFSVH